MPRASDSQALATGCCSQGTPHLLSCVIRKHHQCENSGVTSRSNHPYVLKCHLAHILKVCLHELTFCLDIALPLLRSLMLTGVCLALAPWCCQGKGQYLSQDMVKLAPSSCVVCIYFDSQLLHKKLRCIQTASVSTHDWQSAMPQSAPCGTFNLVADNKACIS